MRKVILYITTSLDGYIASPDGSVDWLFTDQDYGYHAFLDTIDTTLMGSSTYRQVLTFGDFPYAGKTNYVFTREAAPAPAPHVEFVSQDLVAFVRGLRQQEGKSIWLVGGAQIIAPLVAANLIDEYRLFIHPLVLGKGIPLFREQEVLTRLQLADTRTYSSGMVELIYHRV